jgi:Sulfotransferase family
MTRSSVAADAGAVPHEAAGARSGRVPDFFIVGHEKCGTSALDEMLKRHPQIFMPEVKEQRFFVPELRGGTGRPHHDSDRPHTFEAYLEVFAAARPDQLVGEASPQYLRSRHAARRIAEARADARIIAILREPASFLRSFHLQATQNNIESQRDFRKAIELEQDRRRGKRIPRHARVPETLFYSDHVRYVEQLRRYHEVFAAEQVLVLIYDDFRRDNEATLRRILHFLQVDETVTLETVETPPRRAVRSFALKHLAESARKARHRPEAASAFGRAVNALTPAPLHSEAFRARWRRLVYTEPAAPDERFMLELRRRFKPEVVAIGEYLGRDLVSEWGYDRIG